MHLSSAAPASSSSTAHRSLLSNHRGLCIVDFRTSICRIRCFAPRRAPGRGRRQGPALWSVTCRFGAADAQADAVLEPAKETQRLLQPHGCRPAAPMSTDTAISAKKVLPRHMIHLRQKHLAPRARMVYSASPRKLHCHLPIRLSASFCKRWGGGVELFNPSRINVMRTLTPNRSASAGLVRSPSFRTYPLVCDITFSRSRRRHLQASRKIVRESGNREIHGVKCTFTFLSSRWLAASDRW